MRGRNRGWEWLMGVAVMLLVAVLMSSCTEVTAANARDGGYPRVGAYVGVRSGGAPLVKADGTIDSAVCRQFARFPQVALDMNALLISPNIVPTLVSYRPEIEVAGYHLTTHWHLPATFPVQSGDKSFDAYWHKTLQATNGFIAGAPMGYEVDWAQADVSQELTELLVWGLQRLRVKAYFGDYFSPMVAWAGVGNEWNDEVRVRNMTQTVRAIRKGTIPGFRAYGNGTGADRCGMDGTLVEGFPNALATGSFANALRQKDGDWLKSEGTLADKRAMRFALGTACLTGATLTYGAQEVAPGGQPWPGTWWFEEWSVGPGGKADPTGTYVGWLGEPLGAWVKLASGLYVRYFEHGLVLVNPTMSLIPLQITAPRWMRIGSSTPETMVSIPAQDALFLWND